VGDDALRRAVRGYFEHVTEGSPQSKAERVEWRTYCFESGIEHARFIEQSYFSVRGKRVLDVACGWGGHALALASRGGEVVAADLNDFAFGALSAYARQEGFALTPLCCECERLPFPSSSFEVLLALELVEHIADPQMFAREVARVLRPGGVCILSTPAKLRSFLIGEPHYGLRGIAILPLRWQRWVATRIFGRTYPFPIMRQYVTAGQVLGPFRSAGLEGAAVLAGQHSRRLTKLGLRTLRELLCWNFLVVRKPAAE
jgi:ubiquinone/menaquinone biosynthesis C-methylase UbiE